MTKKIDYTGKRTEWLGLWYNHSSYSYISQAISLAQLRDYKGTVRLVMRKNRYYESGTNRPNFQIMLCSSKSLDEAHEVTVEEMPKTNDGYDDGELYVPIEDAMRIARVACDRIVYGESVDDVVGCDIPYYMEEYAMTLTDIIEGVVE